MSVNVVFYRMLPPMMAGIPPMMNMPRPPFMDPTIMQRMYASMANMQRTGMLPNWCGPRPGFPVAIDPNATTPPALIGRLELVHFKFCRFNV